MAYQCKTYYTQNIIKLTKSQYDSLKNGETVKGYTLNSKDTFVLDIDSLYNDIPTKTSQLTNDSGFITSHQSLANYVTLNTEQTISAKKTFSNGLAITNAPENKNMEVFLGIDKFLNGGTVKWINKNDIKLPYSQITGTPTIPTVNNGTLTIQRNGTTVATFTANQAGNTTANITVPNPTDYYWANVKVSSSSSTATTPSVQKIGITGSTTTTAAAAVTMEYDSNYRALKFVFA